MQHFAGSPAFNRICQHLGINHAGIYGLGRSVRSPALPRCHIAQLGAVAVEPDRHRRKPHQTAIAGCIWIG